MNEWTSLLSHFFCLPASSSAASAARRFSAWRCYDAFSNLQLQSHLPGALQHHWMLCCTQPCQCICHSRLQTRIAGAQHQIDQHSRSVNSAGFFRLCCGLQPFTFQMQILYTFCWQLSRTEARTCGNRPYFWEPGSTLPDKNARFRARECFHLWIHAPGLFCFPPAWWWAVDTWWWVDMTMWLAWWREC